MYTVRGRNRVGSIPSIRLEPGAEGFDLFAGPVASSWSITDPWVDTPAPAPAPAETGTAGELPIEEITAPVPPAMSLTSRLGSPLGLGLIGAAAGYFLTRGRGRKLKRAAMGAAAGVAAGYVLHSGMLAV